MKKAARLILVTVVSLMAAVPAVAGHTPNCETDPILAIGFHRPDGCTNPKNTAQHCHLWIQSDAVLKDGSCQNF